MPEKREYMLTLPKANEGNKNLITSTQSILLIGANGSGKTRL